MAPGPKSFVLADQLAYCRFAYYSHRIAHARRALARQVGLHGWPARHSRGNGSPGAGSVARAADQHRGPGAPAPRPGYQLCGRLKIPIHGADAEAPRRAPGRRGHGGRGSALLAVLWLSAALAAIAFALPPPCGGRPSASRRPLDGLRSYYLATGAIDRASVELLWSITNPGQRRIPVVPAWAQLRVPQRRRGCRDHSRNGQAECESGPRANSSTASWSPWGSIRGRPAGGLAAIMWHARRRRPAVGPRQSRSRFVFCEASRVLSRD